MEISGRRRCRTCLIPSFWDNCSERRLSLLSRLSSPSEVSKFLYCFANIKNEIDLELYEKLCDSCLEKAVDTILFYNQCLWANKVLPIVSTQPLDDKKFDTVLTKNFITFINSNLGWNENLPCFICFKSYGTLELLIQHLDHEESNKKGVTENASKTENEQLENTITHVLSQENQPSNENFQPEETNVSKSKKTNKDNRDKVTITKTKTNSKKWKKTDVPDSSDIKPSLNVEEFGSDSLISVPKLLCSSCGKEFKKQCQLEQHMKTHQKDSEKYTYKCPQCHQVVAHLNHLRTHMKTHEVKNGEPKPPNGKIRHLCSICGAGCSSSSNLAVHIRRHGGKMTCTCIVCGKGFPRTTDLTLHMRKHTGEKPYACQVCKKRFSRSDKLAIHIRTHTGEKPYVCQTCGCSYAQLNDLNNHKKKKNCGQKPQPSSAVTCYGNEQPKPADTTNCQQLFSIKIICNKDFGESDKSIGTTDNIIIPKNEDVLQLIGPNMMKDMSLLNMPDLNGDELMLETPKIENCVLSTF